MNQLPPTRFADLGLVWQDIPAPSAPEPGTIFKPDYAKPDRPHIPSGRYAATLIDSGRRLMQDTPGRAIKAGPYVYLTFMLTDAPPHLQGALIGDTLHLWDADPHVGFDAECRLHHLLAATGIGHVYAASHELHGLPLELELITVGPTTLVHKYWPRRARVEVTETHTLSVTTRHP
ncbi:hypothetical protein [Mesorhizobium sp. M0037]|uniref:hypothetical protein n=1 Tax=unclassified Mesorhizobium TaxID=325217 RepID=UPI003338D553